MSLKPSLTVHCPWSPAQLGAEGEIISGHYPAIRRAELVLSSSLHPGETRYLEIVFGILYTILQWIGFSLIIDSDNKETITWGRGHLLLAFCFSAENQMFRYHYSH